jgi:hypothetical protein
MHKQASCLLKNDNCKIDKTKKPPQCIGTACINLIFRKLFHCLEKFQVCLLGYPYKHFMFVVFQSNEVRSSIDV